MNLFSKLSLFIIIGLSSCKDIAKQQPAPDESFQYRMDEIKLTDLKGQSVNMDQYKGKVLFVNFWATWCKPCLQEMPSIQKAIKTLGNESINYLFASDEDAAQIEAFKNGHDYTFNYVRVENLSVLNIMALPTTFIFNKDGKLVFSESGYKQWNNKGDMDFISGLIKIK